MNVSQLFPSLAKQALSIPNLSPEEEVALWEQYKEANSEETRSQIKHRIIAAHLKICTSVAGQWAKSGVDFFDLFSAGTLGLSKAFEKYKPDNPQKARFVTYARWWVKAEIQDFAIKNSANVKLGTTALEKFLFSKYSKILARLEIENPNADIDRLHALMADEWIATQSKKSKKATVIKAIENYLAKRGSVVSLDAPVSGKDRRSKIEFLTSEYGQVAEFIEEQDELEHRRSLFAGAVSILEDRERHILCARKLADPPKTLEDLSKIYDVSRERIRQIEIIAFEKLQGEMLRLAEGLQGTKKKPGKKLSKSTAGRVTFEA